MCQPSVKIRVALYEDNHYLRESLSQLLRVYPEFELVGAYSDASRIIAESSANKPLVIIMDLEMFAVSGIEATKKVHQWFPDIKIVIHTGYDDDEKVFG